MNHEYAKMLAALEKTLKLWQSGAYKDDDYECPLCEFSVGDCALCPCPVLLDKDCCDMYLNNSNWSHYAPRKAIRYLNKMIAMVREKIE